MIIIDKNTPKTYYFPKESSEGEAAFLKLFSQLSKNEFSFPLSGTSNLSLYYAINVDFSGVYDGEYDYSILDSEENVLQNGVLRVGNIDSGDIIYDFKEEYVVYNPDTGESEIIEYGDCTDVVNEAYTTGYLSGYSVGYEEGAESCDCSEAWDEGYASGTTDGFSNGYVSGTTDGFNNGYVSGTTDGFNNGYVSGSTDGFSNGYTSGYSAGWNAGYVSGYTDGSSSGSPIPTSGFEGMYFTINALADGTMRWDVDVQYRLNDGAWTNWPGSLELKRDDVISFKGTNTTYNDKQIKTNFFYDVYGNSMSLLYGDNFENQTVLGSEYVFYRLFYQGLVTNAKNLILPATTLSNNCYNTMFRDCVGLVSAPALPATTLKLNCYQMMFQGCYSLATAPALPATTLASYCYDNMFYRCTALTSAPSLPATTLAARCYQYMFANCTALTTAPVLPATTLAQSCYAYMFAGCSSLASAPALPATTLATYCYTYMFQNCTGLTAAPVLPAKTLLNYCYNNMFKGCTSLNYIKCLATDISASNSTSNWTNNVASAGTFVKDSAMSGWTTGANGIPTGWVVEDEGGYESMYFTIKSLEDGNNINWQAGNDMEYSLNDGAWTAWGGACNLNANDTVRFRKVATEKYNHNIFGYKNIEVYGNIMSLVYGENFEGQTVLTIPYIFESLLSAALCVNAENLVLPATTLSEGCYRLMFAASTITKAPVLPATTLATYCYSSMFSSCNNLNYVKCLATDISAFGCTGRWLSEVAVSGTFVKKSGTTWSSGESGIPDNWTVSEV